jgi:hypothetical protein
VSGVNGISVSFGVSFTVNPAPTYGVSLSQTGTHTFPAAIPGYGAQTAKNITISNTGNQPTGALTIALSGTNSGSFTLSKTSISGGIGVGGNDSFTVVPVPGLGLGTYTATVTASGGNGISASFGMSFAVYAPGTAGIQVNVWVNEDGTLIAGNTSPVISKSAGQTLTVTAAAGLDNIQWSINGSPVAAPRGTAQSISIKAANYPAGTYILGLRVHKNGIPYSTTLNVTVNN